MKAKLSIIILLLTLFCGFALFPPPAGADSIDRWVIAMADDAEEDSGDTDLQSSDLDLARDLVGVRFQDVQVPQGATITNAYIEFVPDDDGDSTCATTIYGEAHDNPPEFQEGEENYNISGRTRTAYYLPWDIPEWTGAMEDDIPQPTPNLKTIVQEIVNRSGWAPGNAMVFIFADQTGRREAYNYYRAVYRGHPERAPKLHIEYGQATTYTITTNAGTGGIISPSGAVTVNEGDDQGFAIIADLGYTVANVLVDGVSQGAITSYTFTNVTADHTISATFSAIPTFTITATAGTGGTISPSGSVTVIEGADQAFTITADTGYAVADVLVDGVSQGAIASYTFSTVTANHTITVSFYTVPTHTITAGAGNNGSIVPDGAVIVNEGDDQGFTITPDVGYSVDDVLVDGTSVGTVTTYTFSNVTADHTIEASFKEGGNYPLISVAGNGGSISPAGTVWIDEGGSQGFTISPDTGYTVYDVEVDGVSVGAVTTYSFSNITQGHTIVASFDVPAAECVDLATVPMGSLIHAAPANIMFVFDDSGSMDNEFVIKTPGGEGEFKKREIIFHKPGSYDNDYLIGDPALTDPDYNQDLRMYWKSQWSVYTNMYYDPAIAYEPWPTLAAADPDTPRINPMTSSTRSLSEVYVTFDNGGTPLDIPFAHYYAYHDVNENDEYDTGTDTVYLVTIDGGQITYYAATITGTGEDEVITSLTLDHSPPDDVVSKKSDGTSYSYAEARQNFANYFSYYRNRIGVAKAAVANVITRMQGVNVGMFSINQNVIQPVLPVKCEGEDQTATLLDILYNCPAAGETPLRGGLQAVGKYFDKDDNVKIDGTAGDDSPWSTAAEGGECQQGFAIVMTDGYWDIHDEKDDEWIGWFESSGDEDGDHNTDFDGPPYGDNQTDLLADHAMYYYERDLATGLGDKVPTNANDSATHQHVVTYTVAFGITGTLNPDDYDKDLKHKVTGQTIIWPEVNKSNDEPEKIDDLYHAAVNGRGEFFSATSSQELVNALLSIMQSMESRIGSAASVSVNGDQLYGTVGSDVLLFQSTYNPSSWIGDVKAYQVDTSTGAVLTQAYLWSAADLLDARSWMSRNIATWDSTANLGREFVYNKLNATQKSQINSDPDIVDYLRGDRSLEGQYGGTFRNRFGVLGDIVHSSPVYENGYLYLGANDGMMHCFDATTGAEQFAYVPNLVFPNLVDLADIEYGLNHKFFVDLSPTITSGVERGVSTQITLLVGGLGGGGKGYYALNVTDPSSMISDSTVASKVMWEFGGDDDMGYTYGKPTIVKSNDTDINTDGTSWIIITGNGYNSVNGNAVLFILNPATGTVLKRFDVGGGPCNGLSTPAPIDVDADGKVDYVYAGDLKGNMWKFDLTDTDSANWGVAYKDGTTPKALFRAPGQPITIQPDVMSHCEKHGYMVIFGTGKYLGDSDFSDTSLQSIYGIWDYGDDDDDIEYLGTFIRGATPQLSNQPDSVTLLRQTYVPSSESDPHFWTVGNNKLRILTANTPDWTTTSLKADNTCGEGLGETGCDTNGTGIYPDPLAHAGWYFDLPVEGERAVSDVMIREEKVIVLSFMAQEDPCGSGGDSIIHEMNACSGARMTTPQFDIDGSGTIGSGDLINIGTEQDPVLVAPTGLMKGGRLQPPAILRLGKDEEMKYYSTSSQTEEGANITTVKGPSVTLGLGHWKEFK
jgi:type IV pilus assembly protein PilY1